MWTVLGAVDQMDLDGFYGAYRANGQGRAAYDPQMMVALLLYAYCVGIRSSRMIERSCRGDVAFRVITAMTVPDHSTVAEFRRRHETAIAGLFVEVLSLCNEAGLVSLGEIAVDGTKLHASASYDRNRGYVSIVEEILGEAEQTDREEDERHGDARGDEVPEALRTRESRRAALEAARERMQAEREAQVAAGEQVIDHFDLDLDPERFVTRPVGREAWLREGRRAVERERDANPWTVARDREERVGEVKARFDSELAFHHAANRAYEHYRATGRARNGRRLGAAPKPYVAPLVPEGKINTTDPDSGVMIQKGQPPMQGYNAQAAVTTGQIVIGADVVTSAPDYARLEPVVHGALHDLQRAGIIEKPVTVLADAGVLACRADATPRQRRDAGPRPTGQRPAPGRPAGLGWWLLRVHAPRPHKRARACALRQTQAQHRTRVWSDQGKPSPGPLPTKRQERRPVGMAADHRHPQPAQASQPPDRPRHRMTPGGDRGPRSDPGPRRPHPAPFSDSLTNLRGCRPSAALPGRRA